MKNIYKKRKNIYITEDVKIKTGGWYIDDNEIYCNTIDEIHLLNNIVFKKIILTTDPQLIADGVQAIDDEFLEWFVKNPSCESVEVEKFHGVNTSIAEVNAVSGDGSLNWEGKSDLRDYKIIIPKEEPKQETLEEAINSYVYKTSNEQKLSEILENAIRFGAKWQKEQDKNKYSEEEVYSIIQMCLGMKESGKTDIEIIRHFEQFKNK